MGNWTITITVMVLLGIFALAAGPHVLRWLDARRLHARLAAKNGLDPDETSWLWQFAQRRSPALPAAVFVRPSLFDGESDAVGAGDSNDRRRAIRRKLFG